MTTYEIVTIIFSSVSLLISIILIFEKFDTLKRNKLSTKTLVVNFTGTENQGGYNGDWVNGILSISNQTNKEFTIKELQVCIDNQICEVYQTPQTTTTNIFKNVALVPPFRLLKYDSIKFYFYIVVAKRVNSPTLATLSIITSKKKLNYIITLPSCEPM